MPFKDILRIYGVHEREGSEINQFYRKGKALVNPSGREVDLEKQIFDLLFDHVIRRGKGIISHQAKKNYLEQINFFIEKNAPIEFIFIGFPFKCHNPFETMRRTPDLGELAFILRLLDIDATLRQIYLPGARFTVLTEGNAYKNLFGATDEEVQKFETRLHFFVSGMGVEKKISFVDFISVCQQFPNFKAALKTEESDLRKNRNTQEVQREIETFLPVMMRSVPILEGVSLRDLFAVFDSHSRLDSLTSSQLDLLEKLLEEGEELAIRYIAFQRTKNKLNVIPRSFPQSLYVSTTSKGTKYSFHPIHRRTRLYPHHGVPILGSDKVDVVFLREVIEKPENYVAVFCPDDIEDAPFYFLKGKQHTKKC